MANVATWAYHSYAHSFHPSSFLRYLSLSLSLSLSHSLPFAEPLFFLLLYTTFIRFTFSSSAIDKPTNLTNKRSPTIPPPFKIFCSPSPRSFSRPPYCLSFHSDCPCLYYDFVSLPLTGATLCLVVDVGNCKFAKAEYLEKEV